MNIFKRVYRKFFSKKGDYGIVISIPATGSLRFRCAGGGGGGIDHETTAMESEGSCGGGGESIINPNGSHLGYDVRYEPCASHKSSVDGAQDVQQIRSDIERFIELARKGYNNTECAWFMRISERLRNTTKGL